MAQDPNKNTPDFNDAAKTDFYSRFTTIRSQFAAMEVTDKAEKVTAQAQAHFDRVVKQNQQTPGPAPTPGGFGGPARDAYKDNRIELAYRKREHRMKAIAAAKESLFKGVEQKQKVRQKAERSMDGRTLSDEFKRRR